MGSREMANMNSTSSDQPDRCGQRLTSCRWMLAVLLCLLRMCQTSLRQSIGMALVCMSQRPPLGVMMTEMWSLNGGSMTNRSQDLEMVSSNQTGPEVKTSRSMSAADSSLQVGNHTDIHTDRREFEWDATFEGIVLSSYYYGYLLTPLLSCYIERFVGAKRLVACCVSVGALVNLLTPELTRRNRYLLVALRVVAGTTNGMIDPAVQSMWAVWAPRSEMAHLTAVEYAGVSLGGIFTFLVSGSWCQLPVDNGWPFIFYFYGAVSLAWLLLWMGLAYNKPSEHPRISVTELKFITSQTYEGQDKKNKIHPPWLRIMSCPAVWAIIVCSSTFMWVYSWILCYLPMYMQDVLHYNISENAILSSMPFVGKFTSGLLCGYLADRLLRTKMSVLWNRKLFQTIGCLGCAACTLVVSFLDSESRSLAVAMLVLAVTAQNVSTVAFRINALDIAPRYASFILAISNTIGVAVSLTAPLVTSAIVHDKSPTEWRVVLYMVAGLSVVGALVFLVLGRATVQDWAQYEDGWNQEIQANGDGSKFCETQKLRVSRSENLTRSDNCDRDESISARCSLLQTRVESTPRRDTP